jgi:HK97 family phage major capsid protein
MADLAVIESELKQFIERHRGKSGEVDARLRALEQALTSRGGGPGLATEKSVGDLVCESEGFKALQRGQRETGKIMIGSLHKTIIGTGTPSALVPPAYAPGIVTPTGMRTLTVRDLLSQFRTISNMVAYTQELVFTNAAAPQAGEGTSKAQSDLTFQLQNAPVQTLAHWIAASTQVLDDAQALSDYINARLLYGLKLVEENQLLTGDGTGQNLSGLITNSTAYNRGTAGGDTDLDVIRKAKTQVRDSNFEADGCIVHPHDWERIELTKTTYGEYIASVPKDGAAPRLWEMNVVSTPAIPVGKFLVGAFKMAAAIWDRNDATIEVSREHQDFFIKNLAAVRCEERLALTVFRPLALIYGALPQTGS